MGCVGGPHHVIESLMDTATMVRSFFNPLLSFSNGVLAAHIDIVYTYVYISYIHPHTIERVYDLRFGVAEGPPAF